MIEVLVARVFSARNIAHLEHWRTKSYAQHMALNDFYDKVIDDVDSIVEAYQGAFSLISIPSLPEVSTPKNIITFLEGEMKWISDNRTKIAKGISAIENLIDGLSDTYLTTLYKLKNLS